MGADYEQLAQPCPTNMVLYPGAHTERPFGEDAVHETLARVCSSHQAPYPQRDGVQLLRS